ncbi:MarR family winged helix-turn-helix transcriptional regulator [Arthrobacter ruber]|uniref:MarR family winged helix-turn-helix transcriptional regulator n=1 Tax=Arthrobacter ruber TaxID=1258893 RepID=UPI0013000D24|nr:MarR family transcriptional regulator [Arthrobacter ruber]
MIPPENPVPAAADRAPVTSGTDHDAGHVTHLDALTDAVRRYRDAEGAMRGRSRESMHLGRTDMTALRLLLRAGRSGRPLSAAALARELAISTAATTVLVDRLEKSGHAERRRSATDGRGVEIWPTASSDEEVRSTMGALHERMKEITNALSPEETAVIHRFLGDLGVAVSALDFPFPAAGG